MEHIVDLIPGYALGCLDDDELMLVARHLPRCAACRAELDSYWKTVDRLAFAVPERIPSADLKEKIMRRAGARTDTPSSPQPEAAPSGGFGAALRAFFARPLTWAAAAALLLIAVLGIRNMALQQQVGDLEAEIVRRGDMRVIHLDGTEYAPETRGYLMVFSEENYGTLVVERAPELPEGYQYQLWLVRDGERTSGGVFSVDYHGYGVLEISSDHPLESFVSFGVTVEPEGGSPGPTGDRVLGGSL